ncbi:transcription factor emb1444 [Quercus suber]|uniref:Transcription factor emb1444 n=1 Tax=Quercus suber TaxID=58331 RepID=A0AAW0LWK0_QUESU
MKFSGALHSEVLIHCRNAQSSTCILQSITKHADKINKCANLKLRNKEPGTVACYRSEHGSIIVENLNKNGQMLVEKEEPTRYLTKLLAAVGDAERDINPRTLLELADVGTKGTSVLRLAKE